MGDTALRHCAVLAGEIRKLDLSVEVGTERKLKRMLELANKLEARYTLIVGDNEIAVAILHAEEYDERRPADVFAPGIAGLSATNLST